MYTLPYCLDPFSQCLKTILVWAFYYVLVCSLRQHLTMELRLASCLNRPCATITEIYHHALSLSTSPTSEHCSSLTNHCASMPLKESDDHCTAKVIPQSPNTRPGTRKKQKLLSSTAIAKIENYFKILKTKKTKL